MTLHNKNAIRHKLHDEVYASADLSRSLPKYKFPEPERDPRAIYAAVHDELMLDGNCRQNLATFCQTWEEPELHKLMDECIDKNIIDKDEYRQTRKSKRGACTCSRTYGTRQPRLTQLAARRLDRAKRPCLAAWR
jgi:glutamate/tyrosine decarboxylase-like PLP-dependent enzyme